MVEARKHGQFSALVLVYSNDAYTVAILHDNASDALVHCTAYPFGVIIITFKFWL